jgi:N-methylhydantoinase A
VYGHHSPQQTVQLVNLRVVAVGKLLRNYVVSDGGERGGTLDQAAIGSREVFFHETGLTTCPVYERDRLPTGTPILGPAILEETSSTVVVYPGQQAEATRWGTITIRSGL